MRQGLLAGSMAAWCSWRGQATQDIVEREPCVLGKLLLFVSRYASMAQGLMELVQGLMFASVWPEDVVDDFETS